MNPNFVSPCHPLDNKQGSQLYYADPSPCDLDCISGRGRRVYNHIGNARFRIIISMYMDKYRKAKKVEKARIVFSIITQFRGSGGNFVKKDRETKEWIEISDDEIKNKVSHALRDAISSTNTMANHNMKSDQKHGFSEIFNSCAVDLSESNRERIAASMTNSKNLMMTSSTNTSTRTRARTRRVKRISGSTASCTSPFTRATMVSSVVSDEECMASAMANRNFTTLPQHTAEPPIFKIEPSATSTAEGRLTVKEVMDKELSPTTTTNSWYMESEERIDQRSSGSSDEPWWSSTQPRSSSLLLPMITKSPTLVQPISHHLTNPLLKLHDSESSATSVIDDIEDDEFNAFISKVFSTSGQDEIDMGKVE